MSYRFCPECSCVLPNHHPNCPEGPTEEEPMSMSANFHLDGMIATVAGYDDPTLTGACVNINDGGYDHIAIHGTYEQLERMGRDIINGVAALRAGPLPDPDEDDDEEDEDATQTEPEAVALLAEKTLVDSKGK